MNIRKPQNARPQRIASLATLPVFFQLTNKKVILIGATDAAFWKAELLAASGANLHIYADHFSEDFIRLAADAQTSRISLHKRLWQDADLNEASLAVADLHEESEIERFLAAARKSGVSVNVIDKPYLCSFQFGSIVNRSPLVIGISTDGAAPIFGQAIRQRIEALLPAGLASWAQAAKDWRPLLQARALSVSARRAIWEHFTGQAFSELDRTPSLADRDDFLSYQPDKANSQNNGKISLVGAGPGDPELLTMKALRILQSADVILYDDLVSAEILELGRREAKHILVGKKGHGRSCKQTDINELMVALAKDGAHVVRLKSGDPGIFGRASEEIKAARVAGVRISIIPGITAAQGAAASLGFSLTERKIARRVQFLTGHGQDGKLPKDILWSAIADKTVSTILYMPRNTIFEFCAQAKINGLNAATPVVIVINATRPGQMSINTTVDMLPHKIREAPDLGPTLVMIGRSFAEKTTSQRSEEGCLAY